MEPPARRRFYGIAEIAEALGVDRQLVTVWRRRSSHGMPPPDDELSSGPLWTAATIEPWITVTRARLAAETGARGGPPHPDLIRQAVRRLLRLTALLLEDAPRPEVLHRALRDLGRLREPLAAGDGGRRGLPELVAVARAAAGSADEPDTAARREALLAECLQAIPPAIRLLPRAGQGQTGRSH